MVKRETQRVAFRRARTIVSGAESFQFITNYSYGYDPLGYQYSTWTGKNISHVIIWQETMTGTIYILPENPYRLVCH